MNLTRKVLRECSEGNVTWAWRKPGCASKKSQNQPLYLLQKQIGERCGRGTKWTNRFFKGGMLSVMATTFKRMGRRGKGRSGENDGRRICKL